MRDTALDLIKKEKLIAILRGIPSNRILDTAKALVRGGIHMMEITFDQTSGAGIQETLEAITLLREALPAEVHLGAGTVMTPGQVQEAFRRGAEYIISPNVDPAVIQRTRELGLISMPGALTPSEIAQAYQYGGDIIKLFPAGTLGSSYLKAVSAPLAHIPLAAVGGVTPENMKDFSKAGACCFGIGSNLANRELAQAGNFEEMTRRAARFHAVLPQCL